MNHPMEKRVSALERTVKREAELRAKVDKDLSDVQSGQRAQLKLIQALRETQVEQGEQLKLHTTVLNLHTDILNMHTEVLNLHTTQLKELSEKVSGLDEKVSGLDEKVSGLDTRVSGLETTFSGFDRKIDRVLELIEPPPARAATAAN